MTESQATATAEQIADTIFMRRILMDRQDFVDEIRKILMDPPRPKKACMGCGADITQGGYLIGWSELCEECATKATGTLISK